ncbi:MAG: hypothetical protein HY816_14385 [Candidatus Wallbacteria bacterium]|nr:hypothetical protein [Candidatus Wallbacteria bacterium]
MPGGLYTYRVHGLRVSMEAPCPGLMLAPNTGDTDVTVHLGEVPRELREPVVRGVAYQATADRFLLDVVSVARFLVTAGSEIRVQPHSGADQTSVQLFLLELVMGAILHQRGLLPLCGSAVETPKGAIVFTGPPAFGKSTLAALFCRRGHRLLSDGVCCIDTSGDVPRLQPSQARLSLWHDSLQRLRIPMDGLTSVRSVTSQRFWCPVEQVSNPVPASVRAIYVLRMQNESRPALQKLSGLEATRALTDSTVLPGLLQTAGVHGARHFLQVCTVARHAQMAAVTRRELVWELDRLAELLEEELAA